MKREKREGEVRVENNSPAKAEVLEPRVFQSEAWGQRQRTVVFWRNKVFVGMCEELKVRMERCDRKQRRNNQ